MISNSRQSNSGGAQEHASKSCCVSVYCPAAGLVDACCGDSLTASTNITQVQKDLDTGWCWFPLFQWSGRLFPYWQRKHINLFLEIMLLHTFFECAKVAQGHSHNEKPHDIGWSLLTLVNLCQCKSLPCVRKRGDLANWGGHLHVSLTFYVVTHWSICICWPEFKVHKALVYSLFLSFFV